MYSPSVLPEAGVHEGKTEFLQDIRRLWHVHTLALYPWQRTNLVAKEFLIKKLPKLVKLFFLFVLEFGDAIQPTFLQSKKECTKVLVSIYSHNVLLKSEFSVRQWSGFSNETLRLRF